MTDKRVFFGVDPGAKGALCVLDPLNMDPKFISLGLPIPELYEKIERCVLDLKSEGRVPLAIIENVHSIQGASAKSNFQFGYNVGSINTILMALRLPLDTVTPKQWQAYLGVKSKGSAIKRDVAQRVATLYPSAGLYGPRGGLLDGNADSLGIAHYYFRKTVKQP